LRALCFADDPWATRRGGELLCSGFTSTTPEITTTAPADVDVAKISHSASSGASIATRCGERLRNGCNLDDRNQIQTSRIRSLRYLSGRT
jgi:hypothetical protein